MTASFELAGFLNMGVVNLGLRIVLMQSCSLCLLCYIVPLLAELQVEDRLLVLS